jgi:hypothetical protein
MAHFRFRRSFGNVGTRRFRGAIPVSASFSAEALNYFSRLDGAGDTTYVDYKTPLANYIDGLVAGGMWAGLESAASFVGVDIRGCLIPLRSDMPVLTNSNFVGIGTDLTVTGGLKGDGSTKYLATGLIGTDLTQDDASLSVYVSNMPTINGSRLIGQGFATGDITLRFAATGSKLEPIRFQSATLGQFDIVSSGSLSGASRSASTTTAIRTGGNSYSSAVVSAAPTATGISVFAGGAGDAESDARLATYTAGASIDLAALEALQDTLISEIAAI